jgi:hypothetical protein
MRAVTAPVKSDRTAVYLAYDAAETLLYIGTTLDPKRRWREHAKDKPWWPQVEYVDWRWFPDSVQAEAAEQWYIARECPPHNRQMPPWYLGLPTALMNEWKELFDGMARLVFAALSDGADLATVAEAAEWSPRYIVRLGQQRHIPWAMTYPRDF